MKEIGNILIKEITNSTTIYCAGKDIYLESGYKIKSLIRVGNAATDL